ncbi:MAG: hypothetical protein FWF91_08050 [Coriobacteriia bacterium]|nr:hypothetical protein [Coriobacteriia bacterium]
MPTAGAQQPYPTYQPYGGAQQPHLAYQPYGVAQQPQPVSQPYGGAPQQAPKKKKAGVIVLIIVAILVVCVGIAIAGYAIFTNVSSGGTGSTGGGGGTGVSRSKENVLLDCEECTITFGTATYVDGLDWIEIEVVVENKTSVELFIFFEDDTTYDGMISNDWHGVLVFPEDNSKGNHFLPNMNNDGLLLFMEAPKSKRIENFKGTIVVCNGRTYDTLGVYGFNINSISVQ